MFWKYRVLCVCIISSHKLLSVNIKNCIFGLHIDFDKIFMRDFRIILPEAEIFPDVLSTGATLIVRKLVKHSLYNERKTRKNQKFFFPIHTKTILIACDVCSTPAEKVSFSSSFCFYYFLPVFMPIHCINVKANYC